MQDRNSQFDLISVVGPTACGKTALAVAIARELGGEIVTVGSDAHNSARVGQYIPEALEIVKETFGYVCTFEKRKPIFHKL